eukprot:TRINITY_DN6281_c0_g1_i1.p1 TRINITY_DN6281_c0_g1~~TRINITY_DN6281_c0_g1_i1.p1  ORF type:complete len:368 (+),score=32.48 TRINITY_DN6281_c0_g1_i1:247-1350(+)
MTYGAPEYDRAKEVKEFDNSKIGVKGLSESGSPTIPRFFVHPPENLVGLKPRPSSSAGIPIVDLSGVNSDIRPEIVKQIRDATRTGGFFQVINHGIPPAVLDSAIAGVKDFNQQPPEIRSQHYNRDMSSSVNFYSNIDLFRSKAASWRDTLQVRMGPVRPDLDRIPQICRKGLVDWDEHAMALARSLNELLSEGLGLRRERLNELTLADGRIMVCHYYPYCPQPELTVGIPPHTDPGVLTVLLQDQIGGLQLKRGEEWVDVKPVPGAVVINVGDFLQMISNNEYKSGAHRVIANANIEPRISIAIFFNPGKKEDSDYYGPLPELLSPEKPALYRNFNMSEFEKTFFSKEVAGLSLLDTFSMKNQTTK